MRIIIENARTLLPDGEIATSAVRMEDGRIAAVEESLGGNGDGERIDARGLMLLPGIVDLHGDAFERQMMPRAGVDIRADVAFTDTDRQMLAAGITTAFHGVTYSFEPGLRGRDNFLKVMDALETLGDHLGCDTRLHLRFETDNLEAVDEVEAWIGDGRVDLIAYNNHTPHIVQHMTKRPDKVGRYTARTGLSEKEFEALIRSRLERQSEVPGAVARLAGAARSSGIAQLSHDDDNPATRDYYQTLGCDVAEFPMTEETAAHARDLGNAIVFGAPNVMRGGSHNGAANAADMVAAGLCTVLASDYYYPSLLNAAFKLAGDQVCGFADAWNLVSRNPARASGLDDRGEIAVGRRADLILVDPDRTGFPVTHAAWVDGRPVYRTHFA